MRPYGARVTLLAQRSPELDWRDEARLNRLGIEIIKDAVNDVRVDGDQVIVTLREGREYHSILCTRRLARYRTPSLPQTPARKSAMKVVF